MCFDPGDRQVMMPANSGEKTPNSLNEGLVTARFDGVVPEKSNAVLAVCEQVDAPPGHGRGGPVGAANPSKSVVDCANLPSIIRGPESSYKAHSCENVTDPVTFF